MPIQRVLPQYGAAPLGPTVQKKIALRHQSMGHLDQPTSLLSALPDHGRAVFSARSLAASDLTPLQYDCSTSPQAPKTPTGTSSRRD